MEAACNHTIRRSHNADGQYGSHPTRHQLRFVDGDPPSNSAPNVAHGHLQTDADLHPPRLMETAHVHRQAPWHQSPNRLVISLPKTSGAPQLLNNHTVFFPGVQLTVGNQATLEARDRSGWVVIDMELPAQAHIMGHANRGHANGVLNMHAVQHRSNEDDEYLHPRHERIPKREHGTRMRYRLFHGNFAIDNEAPSKLLHMCPQRADTEFKYLRYTAATCEPDDFVSGGYTLRPAMFMPPRRTELLIGITMYKEDEKQFCRTMSGVMHNIQYLVNRKKSEMWGKDTWKKIVVCIVSDGYNEISPRTRSVIAAMGCYQAGLARHSVDGKPVIAHIYEYTSQVSVTPGVEVCHHGDSVPVQVIFCLKENNQSKINSHRWLFNAFGPVLEPKIYVLLDVGVIPGPRSIYLLWKSFAVSENVGGAGGELLVQKGRLGVNLLNPLVAAQNFEYKSNSILEKPIESVFGYIPLLSGAFCAYRYKALQNDSRGNGPLAKYFLGEKRLGPGYNFFDANMCLAEDRILAWEMFTRQGSAWTLRYVKEAYAETTVPHRSTELVSQRRKWLNGSLFVTIYAICHFKAIYYSGHTTIRKTWVYIELVYQALNWIFTWFALGNHYIVFSVLLNALEDPALHLEGIHTFNEILTFVYLGFVVICYILALGNRPCPCNSNGLYTSAFCAFSLITLYMMFVVVFLAYKGIEDLKNRSTEIGTLDMGDIMNHPVFKNIVCEGLLTIGAYVFSSLLFCDPWHIFTSSIQYVFLSPSYTVVISVYAFANVHDMPWFIKDDAATRSASMTTKAIGKEKNSRVTLPSDLDDEGNAEHKATLNIIGQPKPTGSEVQNHNQVEEDYYRNITTIIFLTWTLTNWVLAAAVTQFAPNGEGKGIANMVDGYLGFIFGWVAGVALLRFCGSIGYRAVSLFGSGESPATVEKCDRGQR